MLACAALVARVAIFELATVGRDRNAKLVESNSVSPKEYDQALTRYTVALAVGDRAKATLTQARLSIDLAKAKPNRLQLS